VAARLASLASTVVRLRLATALSLLVLGAAACGHGGSATSDATTAPPAAVSSTTSPGVPGSFSGAGSGDFCAQAAPIVQDRSPQQALSQSTDPAALKASFARIVAGFDTLAKAAPQEIKSDVETMRASYRQADALFAKYGYDRQRIVSAAQQDPNLLTNAGIGTDAFQAAKETVSSYLKQVCGLTPPSS
jgi:hypothetical protein